MHIADAADKLAKSGKLLLQESMMGSHHMIHNRRIGRMLPIRSLLLARFGVTVHLVKRLKHFSSFYASGLRCLGQRSIAPAAKVDAVLFKQQSCCRKLDYDIANGLIGKE